MFRFVGNLLFRCLWNQKNEVMHGPWFAVRRQV